MHYVRLKHPIYGEHVQSLIYTLKYTNTIAVTLRRGIFDAYFQTCFVVCNVMCRAYVHQCAYAS